MVSEEERLRLLGQFSQHGVSTVTEQKRTLSVVSRTL